MDAAIANAFQAFAAPSNSGSISPLSVSSHGRNSDYDSHSLWDLSVSDSQSVRGRISPAPSERSRSTRATARSDVGSGVGSVGHDSRVSETSDCFVQTFRPANFEEACDFFRDHSSGFSLEEYWDGLKPVWRNIINSRHIYRGHAIAALSHLFSVVDAGDSHLRLTREVRRIMHASLSDFEGFPSSLSGLTYEGLYNCALTHHWVRECVVDFPENMEAFRY